MGRYENYENVDKSFQGLERAIQVLEAQEYHWRNKKKYSLKWQVAYSIHIILGRLANLELQEAKRKRGE